MKNKEEECLPIVPYRNGLVLRGYDVVEYHNLKEYEKAYKLASELSENEQYFGGSQLGALGIRAFIDMEEGRSGDAKNVIKKILEIDGSINFDKLRRAMKTFIIMDRSFMGKLASTLEKAGISS